MRNKKLKPPKKKNQKAMAVIIVTAVFLVIGIVLAIIGYRNEIIHWLGTTGLALAAISAIPFIAVSYKLIMKKINS